MSLAEICQHEIAIRNYDLEETTKNKGVEQMTCLNCSYTQENNGQYEEIRYRMIEVYERNGYYKRYHLYRKVRK